jgi:AsmA protein
VFSGSASIPDRELDLKGTASLVSGTPGAVVATFEMPFMVQGPWDSPLVLPDPQSRMQRSGAAAPLLDALRKGASPDAMRSVIERLKAARPPVFPPPAGGPPKADAESEAAKTGNAPGTTGPALTTNADPKDAR